MKCLVVLIIFILAIVPSNGFSQDSEMIQEGYMHFPIGEKFFQYKTYPPLILSEETQNRCWFTATFVNHQEKGNGHYDFPKDLMWPGSFEKSTFYLITLNTTSFLDEKSFQKITPKYSSNSIILDFDIKKGISMLLVNSTDYLQEDGKTTKTCIPLFGNPPMDPNYYDHILPLKTQVSYANALGFSVDNLLCRNGHELVSKFNGKLACVSADTKSELIQRGWAQSSLAAI